MQQANGGINVKTSSGSAGSQQSKGSGGASGLQHQQVPPASSGSSTSKSVVDTSSSLDFGHTLLTQHSCLATLGGDK